MTTANIFPHMPQVSNEVLDQKIPIDPDFVGKRIAVLGVLDADGYGYAWSTATTPVLVAPGSRMPFNELTQVVDLAQFLRLRSVSTNVGDTDELSAAIAEIQQQGATNIGAVRLDYTIIKSANDNVLRPVLQSTGKPPETWLRALGLELQGDGTYVNLKPGGSGEEALDATTDWIPSVAYRTWLNDLLDIDEDIDTSVPQAHRDPTFADMRYYAVGRAYNNLIGENVEVVVLAIPPGWVNPARAQNTLGVYPLRPETNISGNQSNIIELGAPTIDNPNLTKLVVDTNEESENYREFKYFDVIGYASATVSVDDASDLENGDTIQIDLANGTTLTVTAAAAQDSAEGEFAHAAQTNAQVAQNIRDAINGSAPINSVSAVVDSEDDTQVNLTSEYPGSDGNISITLTLNTGGLSKADSDGTTFTGSHNMAGERNFAHQMANFCFWQSFFESACTGFIGTEPVDSDLDGIVTAEALRDAIGRERRQVDQYIDDEQGQIFTDNGIGALGFKNMEGFNGIHRRRSNPKLPALYKFFAHSLAMDMVQHSIQENVVLFQNNLPDSLLVDTDRGEFMDMGARIRVTFGDVFVFNPISGRYAEARGAYATNAAVSMAGLYAIKNSGRSLTNLRLRQVVPLRKYSNTQVDALLKARLIPIQRVLGANAGLIVAEDTGAFRINDFARSDYTHGLSIDVQDECVRDIREISKPMLGRGMSPRLVNHLITEVEEALAARKEVGHIQDFGFQILSTPLMQVLGQAQFDLEIVPAFETRKIRIRSGLSMPQNALVAAAGQLV